MSVSFSFQAQTQEVEIWRGVDGAQGTINRKGIDTRFDVEALRKHDLKRVAGGDVFLRLLDCLEEVFFARLRFEFELAADLFVPEFGERRGELLFKPVEAFDPVGISAVRLLL